MSLYTPVAKILFSYYLTHISRFLQRLERTFDWVVVCGLKGRLSLKILSYLWDIFIKNYGLAGEMRLNLL